MLLRERLGKDAGVFIKQIKPGHGRSPSAQPSQLNPLDPLVYITWYGIAFAHFAAERYEESLVWLDRSLRALPSYFPAMRLKIVICAHQGQMRESDKWVARLLSIAPDANLGNMRLHFEASIRDRPAAKGFSLAGARQGCPSDAVRAQC